MIQIEHLESDITMACELRCCGCNHLVSLYGAYGKIWKATPSQIQKDLSHLTTILHAKAWGALGGEPTLNPLLPEILLEVRLSKISDRIEVWTNGILLSNPLHPLAIRLWDYPGLATLPLFDDLILSRYEGKLTDKNVEFIQGMCDNLGVKLTIKDERTWHNFRTNLEPIPTGDNTPETISKFQGCFFKQYSRVVNRGFFYMCCCSPHQPVLMQGRSHGSDGIAIEGLTESALLAYLERTNPLGCCTICAGRDTAKELVWSEERDPEKWLQKSKGIVIENLS